MSTEEKKEVVAEVVVDEEAAKLEAEKKAKKEAKKEAAMAEKAAKEKKKADRLADRNAATALSKVFVKDPNDPCADKFGEMDIIRSQCDPELRFTRKYVEIKNLGDEHIEKEVRIRGRINQSRGKGKMAFVIVREGYASCQVVLFVGEGVSKGMVDFATKLPKESIVEIVAKPIKPKDPIEGCSQQVELQVIEFWCVNKSVPILPFQIEDASRKVLDQSAESGKAEGKVETGEEESKD